MNIYYNDKTNLLYFRLDDSVQDVINKRITEDIVLDVGADGKIIGIEVLNASKRGIYEVKDFTVICAYAVCFSRVYHVLLC
jgi:uncharacterized protein YuzE